MNFFYTIFGKKTLYIGLFLVVIFLTTITRLYKLGDIPNGFYVDEAGQGYSAYSILKTGKDEFGKAFPIVFRSLSDFKTPVYIYLIVPFIPLFGLTAFTVRFPSFLFSVLTIPIVFLLIKELLNASKSLNSFVIKSLPFVTLVLLAISPWHILFGRTNFECNVALFFYLAGVLTFYLGFKKPRYFILSAILFATAIPAYHSQRIITPLTLLIFLFKYKNELLVKSRLPFLMIGSVIAFIILLPTLSIINTPGFLARANGLNIFSHSRQLPDGFIFNYHGILTPIINGSWYLSIKEFLSLYFSYLSPRYMFYLGDYGSRSSFPDLSTFYVWQFPFYLYGLWLLIRGKGYGNFKFFMLSLLLISPIPAAVTRDPYTTIRSLPMVIPQITIISLGIIGVFMQLNKRVQKYLFIVGVFFVILYSLAKLYSSVIILNEYYRARAWDYGWQGVVELIKTLDKNIPVIVDNARNDAYPQLSFFLSYPPDKYQKENFEVNSEDYYTNMIHNPTVRLGNITTRPIIWEKDLTTDQYLIGDGLAISDEQIREHKLIFVSQVNYPDGTPAFKIVRTNPVYELEQKRIFNQK